jgi:hypothetical protein
MQLKRLSKDLLTTVVYPVQLDLQKLIYLPHETLPWLKMWCRWKQEVVPVGHPTWNGLENTHGPTSKIVKLFIVGRIS